MRKYHSARAETAQRVVVRMDKRLIAALDRYTTRLGAGRPGLHVTRADAVRSLLHAALASAEQVAEGGA